MVAMATAVKRKAEMKAGRSPKFSMPMASAPRMMEKFSHERKVRSFAKKTFGSMRTGSAMRLPGRGVSWAQEGGGTGRGRGRRTWCALEEGLAGHLDGLAWERLCGCRLG